MHYEWDESKRQANLEKHGLDLIDTPLILEAEEKATFPARYEQEQRFKAIAQMETSISLLYTQSGTVPSVSSPFD